MFSEEGASEAYQRLENEVESQGHLFECAPAVVAVIIAAVSEQAIVTRNLASCLDVLGRIIAGHADETVDAARRLSPRDECHQEALKGYWSLVRVAEVKDPFNAWRIARDIIDMLDEEHSRNLFPRQ